MKGGCGMAILGIDFGTAFSFPSAMVEGRPETLLPSSSRRGIPSVFYYDRALGVQVGEKAVDYMAIQNKNGVKHVKRYLDYEWDPDGRRFTSTQVCAHILAAVTAAANRQLAQNTFEATAAEAVLAIPAKFGHRERELLRAAAETPKTQGGPGLKVRGFLPEPVAAAMDYAQRIKSAKQILVYDLGAGTFDIALVEPTPGARQPYRVVDFDGINGGAAGNDFDQAFANYLASRLLRECGVAVSASDSANWHRYMDAVRAAKEELSPIESESTKLVYQHNGRYCTPAPVVTRQQFEDATRQVLALSMDMTRRFAQKHSLANANGLEVILVGGSSYMPQVKTGVSGIVGAQTQVRLYRPEQSISYGAARYAANANLVMQIAPHSYAISAWKHGTDDEFLYLMLKKNQPLPTEWVRSGFQTRHEKQTETNFPVFETDCMDDCQLHEGRRLFTVKLKWDNPVPKGTSCPAEMRLSDDVTLELRAINSKNNRQFEGSILLS